MKLSFSPEDEQFRKDVAAWFADNLVGEFEKLKFRGGPGDEHSYPEERKRWEQKLAEGGWTCVGWPEKYGGRGLSIEQQVIFFEEYARAGAPGRMGHIGEGLTGPTLIAFGTEEQKQKYLSGIVSGKEYWCQGYSEPSAGSDLANVKTKARLDEATGKWLITGQKVWTSLAHESDYCFVIARTDDHIGTPIIVSRTGYTGELGFEIWCHPNDASKVWDKVWDSGKDLGITPMGLEGLDMVRIEAGLIFYGYEFNDQTDPFEAGIGFTVALKTKEDDFVGKDALIKRKESPQKKLVGLELIGKEQASNGNGVHVGRATVGIITSGMISPTLNKNIALCKMDIKYSDIGTDVEVGKIDGHQKRIGAKVVKFPFYDPEKLRVKS